MVGLAADVGPVSTYIVEQLMPPLIAVRNQHMKVPTQKVQEQFNAFTQAVKTLVW